MLTAVGISLCLMALPLSSQVNLIGGDAITAKPGGVFRSIDPLQLPGVVKVGGGTGFFYKEGWVLTAAHNIATQQCKVLIMDSPRDCWKHPGDVDIAACHVPVSPSGGLAGEPGYSEFEKNKVYVGAGYGCVYKCSANGSGVLSSMSAGLFIYTADLASREEIKIGPMIPGGCTSACRGDSGGPVFSIGQTAIQAQAVMAFADLKREKIQGVIVKEGAPGAVVARLTPKTEAWLATLVAGNCKSWN